MCQAPDQFPELHTCMCAHTENSIDTPNPGSKEKQGTLASVSQWGLLQSLHSQPVQEPSTTDLLPWQLVNPSA